MLTCLGEDMRMRTWQLPYTKESTTPLAWFGKMWKMSRCDGVVRKTCPLRGERRISAIPKTRKLPAVREPDTRGKNKTEKEKKERKRNVYTVPKAIKNNYKKKKKKEIFVSLCLKLPHTWRPQAPFS